jgi:protein-L-isoaspartate(D-aspartate) O-methyltransferase
VTTSSNNAGQLAGRLAAYATSLCESGAIRRRSVEAAFATVPRHRFVPRFQFRGDEYVLDTDREPPAEILDIIYANNSLLTHTGSGGDPPSSSSAPSVMAKMIEALDLRPGLRVLEIGAGTGYNAALIHAITGTDVVSVEAGRYTAAEATENIRTLGLDDQVQIVHGDGYAGCRDRCPFDRIIVTCGIAGIPPLWLDQLATGARIVAPVAHAGVHPILAADWQPPGELSGRALLWGDFMSAAGPLRPASLFAHDPAEDIPAANARTIPGTGPALTLSQYHDLWCYLGTRDRRITRAYPDADVFDLTLGACALVDPTVGTAWIHRDGSLTITGEHKLGDHLATLTQQWNDGGRPAAAGWQVGWRQASAAGLLLPCHWTVG